MGYVNFYDDNKTDKNLLITQVTRGKKESIILRQPWGFNCSRKNLNIRPLGPSLVILKSAASFSNSFVQFFHTHTFISNPNRITSDKELYLKSAKECLNWL